MRQPLLLASLGAALSITTPANPFVFRQTNGDITSRFVDHRLLLYAGAMFALWNRLGISASMPFALSEGGDDPRYLGVTQRSPDGASAGDLRASARLAVSENTTPRSSSRSARMCGSPAAQAITG